MSTTSIISFKKDQPGKIIAEFNNAWLSAPLLWNYLAKKYMQKESMPSMGPELKRFWDLWKGSVLEEWEAASLVLTYDNCVLKKEDFKSAIENLQQLDRTLGRSNHFKAISEELIKLKDSDIIGVGFIWTSVAGGIWDCPTKKDGSLANISELTPDEEFFFLFDEDYRSARNIK